MFGKYDIRKKLWGKLRHKEYRNAYVSEHVRRWIAHQIRALREHPERKWKQGELSNRMGKPQSVISRLEDPNYGKMTVQTLLEVAAACDVALIIKFVSFERFVGETADLTQSAMQVDSFNKTDQTALHSMDHISFPIIEVNDKIGETGGTRPLGIKTGQYPNSRLLPTRGNPHAASVWPRPLVQTGILLEGEILPPEVPKWRPWERLPDPKPQVQSPIIH
jgi:hypothetical protein